MAEIDTSPGGGIAARLAQLNLQAERNHASPRTPPRAPPKSQIGSKGVSCTPIGLTAPCVPPKKCLGEVAAALPNISPSVLATLGDPNRGAPPSLPARRTNTAPPLPVRRNTNASLNSTCSVNGSRSLPPALAEKKDLPAPSVEKISNEVSVGTLPTPPPLPPRLPPRRPPGSTESIKKQHPINGEGPAPPTPPRPQASDPAPARRRLPPPPPLPSTRPQPVPIPPLIPLPPRPKLPPSLTSFSSTITPCQSSSPLTPTQPDPICLRCRDFTLADSIASAPHLSRTNVSSLQSLALALSTPFPNSTLDIARAIFTWLHHNIAYDTAAFFGNSVKPKSPQETLSTGLAVCQGYAELFAKLVVLGGMVDPLHVKTINGASKGYGHRELKPGEKIPKYRSTHAWNALYIPELGRWQLIDPCWGAGHVTGPPTSRFHKKFNPEMFTMSPLEFGRRHFPANSEDQFISTPLTWEDFSTLEQKEGARFKSYSDIHNFGFDERSVMPSQRELSNDLIAQNEGRICFSTSKTCPHVQIDLSQERLYIITIDGVNTQFLLSPPDPGASEWESVTWKVTLDFWRDPVLKGIDMDGRKVSLMYVKEFDGRDGVGLTKEEWERKKGRVRMCWGGLGAWNAD